MIINDEIRSLMTVAQHQEETVRILREFVRRQELAKAAARSQVFDLKQLQPDLPQRTDFDYTDTVPGDL